MTDFFMSPRRFGGDPTKGADTQEWNIYASDDGGVTKIPTDIILRSRREGWNMPFVRTYSRNGVEFGESWEAALADWERSRSQPCDHVWSDWPDDPKLMRCTLCGYFRRKT